MSDIRSKIWNAVWNGAGLDDGECGSITDNVLALFYDVEAERDELRQALEQARDAALEEAARVVKDLKHLHSDHHNRAFAQGAETHSIGCAAAIRALQSTTTKEEE